jgi:hypothetical protein
MGVNPARHLIHALLRYAIREGIVQLSYVSDGNGGTLLADAECETFELVSPPQTVMPSLISELALLAGLQVGDAESSGSFTLINTTLQSIGSWQGDRPVDVDVSLWRDRFCLSLSYPDKPVKPIAASLTWTDRDGAAQQ